MHIIKGLIKELTKFWVWYFKRIRALLKECKSFKEFMDNLKDLEALYEGGIHLHEETMPARDGN